MIFEVCPDCNSGKLEGYKNLQLIGTKNEVTCLSCGWVGDQGELLVTDMSTELIGGDDAGAVGAQIALGLLELVKEHLLPPVGKILNQAGLSPSEEIKKEMEARSKDPDVPAPYLDINTHLAANAIKGAWNGIIKGMADVEEVTMKAAENGVKPDYTVLFTQQEENRDV